MPENFHKSHKNLLKLFYSLPLHDFTVNFSYFGSLYGHAAKHSTRMSIIH